VLAVLLAPIVVATVAGTLGNAFFPALLTRHPLLLILLDARNRQLVPVAGKVGFVAFVAVAAFRRCVSDPSFYLLGRFYGDDAVAWLERRAGEAGSLVRSLERLFNRIGPLLVFLFPGAIICVFAGATAMNPVLFAVLNVAGTLFTVVLIWQLGDIFKGPIGGFTDFVSENVWWLTALSVVFTAYYVWDQRRRGKSRLQDLANLEQTVEADDKHDDEGEPQRAGDTGSDLT
jgi:membrane protein DedA with SNARE-associated domain